VGGINVTICIWLGHAKLYPSVEYMDLYNPDRAVPLQEKQTPLVTLLGGNEGYPTAKRIEDKRRGRPSQRYPIIGKSAVMFF
jgi:hypothetical protein